MCDFLSMTYLLCLQPVIPIEQHLADSAIICPYGAFGCSFSNNLPMELVHHVEHECGYARLHRLAQATLPDVALLPDREAHKRFASNESEHLQQPQKSPPAKLVFHCGAPRVIGADILVSACR